MYLLPKGTKGSDVTLQLPRMTKSTVTSLKKKPYEQNHSILEYNPTYIILYVACVICHTFIWLLQTNTLTQNKYCAYSNIRLSSLHNLSIFRNDVFKLVYSCKANPHFSDDILQKKFSSYIQENLGILFLLDKKKSHLYYY